MPYIQNPNYDEKCDKEESSSSKLASKLATTNTLFGGTATTNQSSNWKIINSSIHVAPDDHLYEDGEVIINPANGNTMYFASISISNRYGWHHWKIFQQLHPDIDYIKVGVFPSEKGQTITQQTNIVFFNEEDHIKFEEWFSKYQEEFEGQDILYSNFLPPPPTEMPRSYQHKMCEHSNQTELALWARQSCKNRVYTLGNYLFFLDEEDMVAYKLTFS